MHQTNLPADPGVIILGICSIIIGFIGCSCYGITAIIPLILGIIGLVISNKSLRIYQQNPEGFYPQSKSNVFIGKILNIIGIVINGIIVLIYIYILIGFGSLFSSIFKEGITREILNQQKSDTIFHQENIEEYDDSEQFKKQDSIIKVKDSVYYESKK